MTNNNKIEQAWKAVQYDKLEELKQLVPSQVPPSASLFSTENHVHSLLMCASAHGSISCLRYLIQKKAPINAKNFAGYTALHWAAYTGRTEVLPILIKAGADLESQTEDGKTPLHIAALRGHLDFVVEILNSGADLNAVASNGWTSLHFAIISNQEDVAKKLVELQIDASSPDAQGKTLDDLAKKYGRTWAKSLFH